MTKSSVLLAEKPAPHILVVDDDDRLRNLLRDYLSSNGFLITTAEDAPTARAMLARLQFDLAILDVMMPGEDGFSLGKSLREMSDMPILFLTARGESKDRIAGLRTGADDYLPKPFEPEELVLRLGAILRRQAAAAPVEQAEYQLGPYRWSPEMGELHGNNTAIKLSDMENKLLRALASKPGQPMNRDALAELMGIQTASRSIDVMVVRLRRKLGDDPQMPRILQTLRGQGYVLRIT
ncbi:MAG TPA: response regulator [Alphaproteobacteria bacterium]|nr:DNA-binding response regulator [Rhodospirillaceae bacterium]HRJ12388.1 response regulator [Alphaproteobacteria bacterium]